MIEDVLERIAAFEVKRPLFVIVSVLLFTLFLSTGFFLIHFQTSFEQSVPKNIESLTAMNEIRNKIGSGGTDSIVLIFQINPEDPQYVPDIRDRSVIDAISIIEKQIANDDRILSSFSIADIVGDEKNQNEINRMLDESETRFLISKDKMLTTATFNLMDGLSSNQKMDLINQIRNIVTNSDLPPGIKVKLAGTIVVESQLGKTIGRSTGFVTVLGFIGVFIVLYIFFRKPSFVAITSLPILFGTLWTFGTMGLIGIQLSSTLTGVFSMIIGLGIDFGMHIVHRFNEDRETEGYEQAICNAVKHVGKGLTLTSTTTIIGFLALLSATLPMLHDFAIALSFGVFYSLISAIIMIPAMLVMVERK